MFVEAYILLFIRLILPPIEAIGLAGKRGREPRSKPKAPT